MFQVPCFNFVYFYIHLMELDSFRLSTLLTTLINARVCKFSSCLMILSLSRSCFFFEKAETEEPNLQQHRGRIFHVFAEVLQPFGANGTVDCSVISTDRYRDESAFFESEMVIAIIN